MRGGLAGPGHPPLQGNALICLNWQNGEAGMPGATLGFLPLPSLSPGFHTLTQEPEPHEGSNGILPQGQAHF